MTSTRDPIRDLMALQERMNQLFEQVLSKGGAREEEMNRGEWSPSVDIEENRDQIVLRADVPGVPLEQIEIKIQQNNLTIRGERPFHRDSRREDFHRIERPHGSFYRAFTLPQSIDQEKVQAELKNGVLEITLPKRVEAREKQIRVEIR